MPEVKQALSCERTLIKQSLVAGSVFLLLSIVAQVFDSVPLVCIFAVAYAEEADTKDGKAISKDRDVLIPVAYERKSGRLDKDPLVRVDYDRKKGHCVIMLQTEAEISGKGLEYDYSTPKEAFKSYVRAWSAADTKAILNSVSRKSKLYQRFLRAFSMPKEADSKDFTRIVLFKQFPLLLTARAEPELLLCIDAVSSTGDIGTYAIVSTGPWDLAWLVGFFQEKGEYKICGIKNEGGRHKRSAKDMRSRLDCDGVTEKDLGAIKEGSPDFFTHLIDSLTRHTEEKYVIQSTEYTAKKASVDLFVPYTKSVRAALEELGAAEKWGKKLHLDFLKIGRRWLAVSSEFDWALSKDNRKTGD